MARAPAEQAQVVPAPPKPGGTHRPLSGTPPLHAREDGASGGRGGRFGPGRRAEGMWGNANSDASSGSV